MSLFKKLGGQRDPDPAEIGAQYHFDREWERAVVRFGAVTGLGPMHVNLKHPTTGELMTPHAGLEGIFEQWKTLRTEYDRRALLAEQVMEFSQNSMNVWHGANFLVAQRQAQQALAALEQAGPPTPGAEGYAQHCAAYANALLSLTRYEEALAWAQKACDPSPGEEHFRTLLADALHLSGRCDEAHAIYSEQMARVSGSAQPEYAAVDEMFSSLFARESGVVSSPVFALAIAEGLSDPLQAQQFWNQAETEFYYSPHFRMHHAYHLTRAGEVQRGFAKLVALVQEMPWVKEASLNLLTYFSQFDPEGRKILPQFQVQLRKTVQEQGWTTEGMHEMQIHWGNQGSDAVP